MRTWIFYFRGQRAKCTYLHVRLAAAAESLTKFCLQAKKECGRWDLNPHGIATTGT